MKRLIIFILIIASFPYISKSQQIEVFNDLMSDMYNFKIYEPKGYDPVNSTDMPVVMFLHGRSMSIGLGGYSYGPITSMEMFYSIFDKQKALIVEPNARGNEGWGSVKLHKVYEFLKAHYAFDHNKFYVIGMSMGGWGTLNYVNKYPDEVAACIGICGGCDAKTPCGLNKVPTWIVHAADDDVTPVSCSDRVVEAMKSCGSTNLLKYSRLTKGGHSLIELFRYKSLYKWLFLHNRTNRSFNSSIDFINAKDAVFDEGGLLYGVEIPNKKITQSELAKIQARTPRSQQNGGGTIASNNNSGSAGSNTTKPANSTSKPGTTTKPATSSSNKPHAATANNRNTAKPTATAKPATATAKPVSSNSNTYIVKNGDTLKKIARKHKIKYKNLLKINHFTKHRKIKPGDKIKVKP